MLSGKWLSGTTRQAMLRTNAFWLCDANCELLPWPPRSDCSHYYDGACLHTRCACSRGCKAFLTIPTSAQQMQGIAGLVNHHLSTSTPTHSTDGSSLFHARSHGTLRASRNTHRVTHSLSAQHGTAQHATAKHVKVKHAMHLSFACTG